MKLRPAQLTVLAPLILSGASCFSAPPPRSALTAGRASCFRAPHGLPPRGLCRAHTCARQALRNGGYGTKEYWDDMYRGEGDLPAEEYSWYCGWDELAPFWQELVPDRNAQVLVPGIGNDGAIVGLFDAGWRSVTAFDYSEDAVTRARALLGDRDIELLSADATNMPFANDAFDAVLDKGVMDAINIAGDDSLLSAAAELARVVRPGGVVFCLSKVVNPGKLVAAFPDSSWEMLRGSSQWRAVFTDGGSAAQLDVASILYAWRRLA